VATQAELLTKLLELALPKQMPEPDPDRKPIKTDRK